MTILGRLARHSTKPLLALAFGLHLLAQAPATNAGQVSAPAPAPANEALRPNYVLGTNDQVLIRAFEMEDISDKPYLVDGDGNINLPTLGRVHAAGLSVQQLEADLVDRLKTYVRKPQVTVTMVQFRNEPVFFVGAFQRPGIYPLSGQGTLVEMMLATGGLAPNASRRIKVARRKEMGPIPLPNATESSDGTVTTVEVSMGSLRENVNPAEDIVLKPFDVVTVERAELVYINGEVGKVGGIELAEKESVSVSQAITIAGGLGRDADLRGARILRPVMGTAKRAEIVLNLESVFAGRANDFPLLPNDILHIPRKSSFKRNLLRALPYAIPAASAITLLVLR